MKTLFTIIYGLNLCEFVQGQGYVKGFDENGRETRFIPQDGRLEVERLGGNETNDLFVIWGATEKEECQAFLRFLMMIAPPKAAD